MSRLTGGLERPNQEVDAVRREAVAVRAVRPPLLQVADRPEDGGIVIVREQHRGTIVSSVDDVIDETVNEGARQGDEARTRVLVPTRFDRILLSAESVVERGCERSPCHRAPRAGTDQAGRSRHACTCPGRQRREARCGPGIRRPSPSTTQ